MAIDKRLAAEKAAIAKKYEQENLKRQAAKVTVPPAAVSEERGFFRPAKACLLLVMTAPGALVVAANEGIKAVFKPTASPLENPVSAGCRGLNTMKNQMLGNIVDYGMEFCTPFSNKQYADPSRLNCMGQRTIQRGPVTQILETSACAIPIVATSTGIIAPFVASMTVPEMVLTTGAISSVGSVGVGEAADMAEKKLVK